MAARNVDAAAGSDPDGFMPSRPRDEPLETGGHKPGVMVGNDAAPEFHVQTLPAGSAPADKTFKPQNGAEVPPSNADSDAKQPAANDLPGATSGDVHKTKGPDSA